MKKFERRKRAEKKKLEIIEKVVKKNRKKLEGKSESWITDRKKSWRQYRDPNEGQKVEEESDSEGERESKVEFGNEFKFTFKFEKKLSFEPAIQCTDPTTTTELSPASSEVSSALPIQDTMRQNSVSDVSIDTCSDQHDKNLSKSSDNSIVTNENEKKSFEPKCEMTRSISLCSISVNSDKSESIASTSVDESVISEERIKSTKNTDVIDKKKLELDSIKAEDKAENEQNL